MVKIKIHRGTNQIGGTITEIYTENTHIFIDFGSELSVSGEESTDPAMVQMIQSAKCDGVLFTHYHGDHIGLMGKIPEKDIRNNPDNPIWLGIGEISRKILQNIHKTLYNNTKLDMDERMEHKHMLDLLCDDKRWKDFKDGEEFEIGDFKITPVRVDHSAYDAFLLIIEAQGKCIVHTGDFRTHGRLGKDMFSRISKILEGKRVDVLLTEGTMMSRMSEKVLTEDQLEKKALFELKKPENKYAFLLCSSTNMESLASFHNAALYLKRPFIVNHYVYEQLLLYREFAGVENYKLSFWKSYPFEPMYRFNPKLKMTQPEYMKKHGFVMLVGTSEAYTKRMEEFRREDPLLIYSMWNGYLQEENEAYNLKLRKLYDNWPRHLNLHTSGHACKEDIEEMIRCVCPTEAIIPIHTEKKELFRRLDIGELKDLVNPLADGDCYVVGERGVVHISGVDDRNKTQDEERMKREVGRLIKKCEISDKEIQKYQVWAEIVQKMLQEDTNWKKQYEEYATSVIKKGTKKITQCRKKIHVPKPLACYLTLGNIKNGNSVFDLRYLGQSVGEIQIKEDGPILVVSEKKAENSNKFFGYDVGPCNEPWATGAKAKDFRDFYKNRVDKSKFPRQKEHMVETRLFRELEKAKGADKQLKYIQPIKFANCFTHMKTALAASNAKDDEISVTKTGGEIDIFCRRKVGNESRLTVIEVKDKPEKNESFKEAMFQAIAYAVFIRELIHTPHGSKWMEIWGINDKKTSGITINAVVAIPVSDEAIPDFHGQEIKLGNDTIELHYMALGKAVLDADGAVYFETSLEKKDV